ncbi:hypothetical protein G7054_g4431 [Neopestalotiopsis clavispora]|nr:hypothetical protein G7054_g4431 [Neopestalotiopsis clavispora]
MLFRSKLPEIEYPSDLTIWEWAFEDPRYSHLFKSPRDEIGAYSNAVTALVREYGMQQQDTVSVISPSTVWYPVAMFAVLRAGGRMNGVSPAYGVTEMIAALRTAKTKYIFTSPSSIAVVLAAIREVDIPPDHVFLLEGTLSGFTTTQSLLTIGRKHGKDGQADLLTIPRGHTNDMCGFLTFSSGTTGLPKAVMISHKNVIAQCAQLAGVSGSDKKRQLASLPLFHIANSGTYESVSGLVRFLNWPIASNDDCVMLPQFSLEAFLQAIAEYRITDLTLVPSIVIRIVLDPIVDKYDLSSVKRVACGAAPLGMEVLQLLAKKMPWSGFRQSYGMTESCCCLSTHPPELQDYAYGNNGGVLLGSTTVKVVDPETGRELGFGENGEILAKGPQIAMGYLDNATETAETFGADGFLHTGDVGNVDEHGFISIVDRIKEMFKVKGHQVSPADLEHLLVSHPDVGDCAVVGIPDDYSAERPKAYIVLRHGTIPSPKIGQELLQFVKDNRVRYKWVREIEFISEVPKGPSGKVLRRLLKTKDRSAGYIVKDVSVAAKL